MGKPSMLKIHHFSDHIMDEPNFCGSAYSPVILCSLSIWLDITLNILAFSMRTPRARTSTWFYNILLRFGVRNCAAVEFRNFTFHSRFAIHTSVLCCAALCASPGHLVIYRV